MQIELGRDSCMQDYQLLFSCSKCALCFGCCHCCRPRVHWPDQMQGGTRSWPSLFDANRGAHIRHHTSLYMQEQEENVE